MTTTHTKERRAPRKPATVPREYTFLLRYRLSEDLSAPDDVVSRLAEHGCRDALIGIGAPGRVALEFAREADSAESAFLSALRDVREALPGARLVEAGPDLAGLTEAADLVGVSRQNLHKLRRRHSGSFPPPVHDGTMAIWHLSDLLSWLEARQEYQVPCELREIAGVAKQINLARSLGDLEPALSERVKRLIA